MPDPKLPQSRYRRHRALALGATALALLTWLGGRDAHAVDGTWVGATTDWADPANWTSNPDVPDGTATFSNAGSATVDSASLALISAIQFTAAPNAQAFTINNNTDIFAIYGAGISNNSTNLQTFNVFGDGLIFINSATASGGSGAVTINNISSLIFQDSSTAGNATLVNTATGQLNFFGTSSAGTATLTNDGNATFNDNTTAGTAQITNSATGTLTFSNASTAAGATIANDGIVQFSNTSTAGTASITNNASGIVGFSDSSSAQGATILNSGGVQFSGSSRAGTAAITNDGTLDFLGASSADHATITNNTAITFSGTSTAEAAAITYAAMSASTSFSGNSSAGNATFQSLAGISGAFTSFFDASTAGSATIVNSSGMVSFTDTATAGSANITNTGSLILGPAITMFDQISSAGNATIINNFGGMTIFDAQSLAGTATVINNPGGATMFGLSGVSAASADHATILNAAGPGALGTGGITEFFSSTTAGNATITTQNAAAVAFFDTSSGGAARFITEAGGVFDMSQLTSTGMTAGSIEGAGTYYLGSKELTVGGNNLSTLVNGVISDGSCGCFGPGGTGGSLVKVGTGTLTLSGINLYTGPTTVTGGTLAIAAGGSITSNVSNAATFSNAGTVTGTLVNSGTATNSGTITGMVTNSAGLFRQTAGIVAGGLINNANADIQNGAINGAIFNNAGTFVAGSGGGTVTSDSTFANAGGATLGVAAGGSYTIGGLLTNSGTISVASGATLNATAAGLNNAAGGVITVAAGGTLRDDLNNAGTVVNGGAYFANVASNTGSITNAATGTWTGNVISSSGTIINDGIWNGSIASSGVLRGAGSVATLSVTGGTFAPGNGAPGSSMTINGNLTLASAAQYIVQVNPTTASSANVSGTATLGGAAVTANFAGGNYISKKYAIVNAAGVVGTFGGLTNNNLPTNFTSSLSYDATHAYLDLTLNFVPPPPPPPPGPNTPVYAPMNQNQQNVGNALVGFFNRTGGIPLVFGTLTPAGLTQVSGETATGSQQTTFDAMNLFIGLLTDPFVAGRGEPLSPSVGPMSYADADALAYAARSHARSPNERDAYAAMYRKAPPLPAPSFEQRWSVWAAGFGGSQTTDGNAAVGSNTATSRIYGGAVGADYRISPNTLAGFALAGGGTNFSVANAGTGRSDLFQAGAFLRHTVGPAYLSAALAYGWQEITTDRTVTIAGVDRLRANFNANAWSGRLEGGYRYAHPWLALTPYAAGQFTSFELPAYAESVVSGANTFALGYGSKTVTASRSELGLRSDKSWALGDGLFTLRGRAAWAHNFDTDRTVGATFQTLPGASFVVNGAAQARDAALTSASAEMKFASGLSLAATFEGEFSDVTRSYAGKGVARFAW